MSFRLSGLTKMRRIDIDPATLNVNTLGISSIPISDMKVHHSFTQTYTYKIGFITAFN